MPAGDRLVRQTAALVQHRQVGETDTGLAGRRDDGGGHAARVVIGPTLRAMVQIVELGDGSKAGFQHFHVGVSGNGLQILRRHALDKTVHLRAPAPETIALCMALLGATRHGPLECVAVQVGSCGQQYALGQALIVRLRRAVAIDRCNPPGRIDTHPDP